MNCETNINILMDLIETLVDKNSEWYYHSLIKLTKEDTLSLNDQLLTSILLEGIKCNKLLGNSGSGCTNGKYYVCLSKDIECSLRAFDRYVKNFISIIISDIEPIKCSKGTMINTLLRRTRYSGRSGASGDEFQFF